MQFQECSSNDEKYQEINRQLVSKRPTPGSSTGNLTLVVYPTLIIYPTLHPVLLLEWT